MTSEAQLLVRRRRGEPWSPMAVLWFASALTVSGLLIFSGYIVTSGTLRTTGQLTGLNVALGALLMVGAACVAWLAGGYRAVRERERSLVAALPQALANRSVATPARPARSAVPTVPAPPTEPTLRLVSVAKGTRYHRDNCALVIGKVGVQPVVGDAIGPQLQACGVCRP